MRLRKEKVMVKKQTAGRDRLGGDGSEICGA